MESNSQLLPFNLSVHTSLDDVKKFYTEGRGMSIFQPPNRPTFNDLATGTRNLITGEPGMGKTTLLSNLERILKKEKGFNTKSISLKIDGCIDLIDDFIKSQSTKNKALLLDGLDEVSANSLSPVLEKIISISALQPSLSIYITSRWNFLQKSKSISALGYRFIAISPLLKSTVREKLITSGYKKNEVDTLLGSYIFFNHGDLVLQTPRYLEYFLEFLKTNDLKNVKEISRAKLFENIIYRELELEDKRLNTEKRSIIKRVLEKIALIMEILQTNVLKKDDLMTFFDDLESELCTQFLAQVPLEIFYDKYLLKNNIETIEFENTEFQEYLAAKEISRFSDPQRVASNFAIDPNLKEIHPSWFNALNFLVDIDSNILGPLIEFSGLRDTYKTIDSTFFSFLSRVNFGDLNKDLRKNVFKDIFEYYQRVKQWLPGSVALNLPDCFEQEHIAVLKKYANKQSFSNEEERVVQLANLCYVVAALFEAKTSQILAETDYWKALLLSFIGDKNEGTVLQRHALEALEKINDPTVINRLPDLIEGDELVARAFISLCTELSPNSKKSLDYLIKAVKTDNLYGKFGILHITTSKRLKELLKILKSDEGFRQELLKDMSLSDTTENELALHIRAIFDNETERLIFDLIVESMTGHVAYEAARSSLFVGLFKLMKQRSKLFVKKIVKALNDSGDNGLALFSAETLFEKSLDVGDAPAFVKAMIKSGKRDGAMRILTSIKISSRKDGDDMYEVGRKLLAKEYTAWEALRTSRPTRDEGADRLKEFRRLLQPTPGKYMTQVFEYFVRYKDLIHPLMKKADKNRLKKLISGSVFKVIDPSVLGIKITNQTITANSGIFYFGYALKAAEILSMGLRPYKQRIINFIPFAQSDDLDSIFKSIGTLTDAEIQTVINVYKNRHTDLWKYQPLNFINTAKEFFLSSTAPVLKEFVLVSDYDFYTRKSALETAELLAPDVEFLNQVFSKFSTSTIPVELQLAFAANGLLISSHQDPAAIRWRIKEVLKRAAPFVKRQGVHTVSELENELNHDMPLAKPLMGLSSDEFISEYLKIIDNATELWSKDDKYHEYANYLWNIVYSYFEQLAIHGSYEPLKALEEKILLLKDKQGLNWFASRIPPLRRLYLDKIAKPRNVSFAIKQYNNEKNRDKFQIIDSEGLFHLLCEVINLDLKKWIEGEGAYELIIGEKVFSTKHQRYEDLIQKTIKSQFENILLKKGFQQIDIEREVQLLDGKKVDFIIRYGFIGPIVLELKLTSNKDISGGNLKKTDSYKNMQKYLAGYDASHGIFLIINNTGNNKIQAIKRAYEGIKGVTVLSLHCGLTKEVKSGSAHNR